MIGPLLAASVALQAAPAARAAGDSAAAVEKAEDRLDACGAPPAGRPSGGE